MNRPARQLNRLVEKVATNESRSQEKKLGKRTKRWRKWIAKYTPAPPQA